MYEPAASVAPIELWPVHLALAVWVAPFTVVAVWLHSGGAVRDACRVCGIAAATGVAVTLGLMVNPDDLIFLTTRSDRPLVSTTLGIALTVIGLVLVASVVRQLRAWHVNRLVASAVVFGGAGVRSSTPANLDRVVASGQADPEPGVFVTLRPRRTCNRVEIAPVWLASDQLGMSSRWKDILHVHPFLEMPRRDVIDVARCGEASLRQITRDLEIVETCLSPSVIEVGDAPPKRSLSHSNVSRAR